MRGRTVSAPAIRRIWLVADDYGISRAVNDAIRTLIRRQRLNATSVMVAGPGFDREQADLLAALAAVRTIAIGLHLTLTAPFKPLSRGYGATHTGAFLPLGRTLLAALVGRISVPAIVAEVHAQIDAFRAAFGRLPAFIDGHQHVQLFPKISDGVLVAAARRAPDAWIRQCGAARLPLRDRKALLLHVLSHRLRRCAAAMGMRTNPAFAGTYDFRPDARFADLFPGFLGGLPDGGVIMCHPGIVDADLVRTDPLTSLREHEYEFLNSDAYPRLMAARGYALI